MTKLWYGSWIQDQYVMGSGGGGRKGGFEKEKSGIYVRVWKCFLEIFISMQNNFPIIAGWIFAIGSVSADSPLLQGLI